MDLGLVLDDLAFAFDFAFDFAFGFDPPASLGATEAAPVDFIGLRQEQRIDGAGNGWDTGNYAMSTLHTACTYHLTFKIKTLPSHQQGVHADVMLCACHEMLLDGGLLLPRLTECIASLVV